MPGSRRRATQPETEAPVGQRILKKYPNRRLYDTHTSSYITIADVKSMVLKGIEFQVLDARSGDDLTRSTLLQIILEEETAGVPLFSTAALAQIIRFYGNAMQGLMGAYLEKNLQGFADLQGKWVEQSKGLFDPKAFTPEMWTQMLSGQGPQVPGLMGSYLEQSRGLMAQMQEQMAKGPAGLFTHMPGMAGFGAKPKP